MLGNARGYELFPSRNLMQTQRRLTSGKSSKAVGLFEEDGHEKVSPCHTDNCGPERGRRPRDPLERRPEPSTRVRRVPVRPLPGVIFRLLPGETSSRFGSGASVLIGTDYGGCFSRCNFFLSMEMRLRG